MGASLVALALCLPALAQNPPASSAPIKARVLLVTGIDYPGHLWRQTAPVLAEALRKDTRLDVITAEDPQFLDSAAVNKCDALVMHWENWEQPPPDERARENLKRFVEGGKGILLLHYACGEWHDEWPEFAKLAGRVWAGPKVRQHDPYGAFRVELVKPEHPILKGLADFDTQDELYTCLTGDHPIEILAQARSKVDGQYYPMAFISNYGKGRTFHCTLGHDVKALSVPAVQELMRRGCAWTAGLPPVAPPSSK
jgi:type 1 glutamine amidotransferase